MYISQREWLTCHLPCLYQVGDAKYKFLEQNLWAASQRFACDNGKYSTELRVSKIMAGKGSE